MGAVSLVGVVVALGGQTPLKLARTLERAGIPVLGTSPDSIDLAEDRERFHELCTRLGIAQPPGGTATTTRAGAGHRRRASGSRCWCARRTCSAAGPCRSSTTTTSLVAAMDELAAAGSLGREGGLSAERPVLVDRFLEDAVEVDVDAIRDATGDVDHRRRDGAHRGGRRALGRLRVRDPAADPERGDGRPHRDPDPARWPTRSTSAASSTCSTR